MSPEEMPGMELQSSDEKAVELDEEEEALLERGEWDHKIEFILSCVGLSVGLGNLWRFPYLAYENGGAAFLIAYLILQILVGKPMYFLELSIGQYSGKGTTKVWDMNPAARGIGFSMCLIAVSVAVYYNIIMAYTLFYFFASMQETLPWTRCTKDWIDKFNCVDRSKVLLEMCTKGATTNCTCSGDDTIDKSLAFTCSPIGKTAAELYFFKEVLQVSDGIDIDQIGTPIWKLAMLLLLSWTLTVICLIKGIKSTGKVVYFTATFPYFILIILLVRGCLLEGAVDGIKYFIVPTWSKLLDINVWVSALSQMFFSLNVSFGGIIMFGSYSKFRNPIHFDAMFISMMDLITSVIAGFVVFSVLGGLAHKLDTTVDKVAKSGYGLAFVVYPEALAHLPPSQLWSIIFFFMLFILGLDSEFGLLETALTSIQDEYPKLRKYKAQLSIGLGVACYLCALPCSTPGGDYVVNVMDHYGADIAVSVTAFIEVVAVTWGYGALRLLKDIEYMLGRKPHGYYYWAFTWLVTSPVLIGAMLTNRMIGYKSPAYSDGTTYPSSAIICGWLLFTMIICPIPIFFARRCLEAMKEPEGTKLAFIFSPSKFWLPNDAAGRASVRQLKKMSSRQESGFHGPTLIADDDFLKQQSDVEIVNSSSVDPRIFYERLET